MKKYRNTILFAAMVLSIGCSRTTIIPPSVLLLGDVDRDGIVAPTDALDTRAQWSRQSGVLFFYNADSDESTGQPDWADERVNGPEDVKDLAQLNLTVAGNPSSNATLALTIDDAAVNHIRLFRREGDEYIPLPAAASHNLPATSTELLLEGKSYASAVWDGRVTLTATLREGVTELSIDTLQARVAPYIMLSNAQPAIELYVREHPGRNDAFLSQLREVVPAAEASLYVIPAGEPYPSNNIWIQDAMEVGYMEIPGQRMDAVFPANRNKGLDAFPKNSLLGPDYGWFTVGNYRPEFGSGDGGNSWIDWFGNLEVSPPVPGHPLGLIYYGTNGDAQLNPDVIAFLDAQEVQGPAVGFDVGWLEIKHVDEMFCFVPTGIPEEPHRLIVPDFDTWLSIAEKIVEDGHGDLPVLTPFRENETTKTLLANQSVLDFNRKLFAERIPPIIEKAKQVFSLRDEDIIRFPALYTPDGGAVMPNVVNSVVLNNAFLVSDPQGPVIEGKDPYKEFVRQALDRLPYEVHFLDDRQYHKWSGNTHCATNVKRQGWNSPWWEITE